MNKKHVLIVSPGILPIPAVNGGAVESLIENFAIENEIYKLVKLTVVSVWNADAHKKAEKFKETRFTYIRMPFYKTIGDFGIYTYMDRVKKDWRCMFYRHHYREQYYMDKVANLLQKNNYDLVIFENCMSLMGSLRKGNNLARYAGKYDYHMHAAVLDVDCNRDLLTGCRRIIAVSDYVRDDIFHAYEEIRPEQVTTVKNGVSVRRFGKETNSEIRNKIRRNYGVDERTVFFYSGRLSPEKGVLELIRAFKKSLVLLKDGQTDPVLLLCGAPFFGERMKNSYYASLVEEAEGFEEFIRFIGFVPYEKMADYYQAADVIIIPSTAPDAAPLVLLEGMLSPAAVAASNVGGIPEYAGDTGAVLFSVNEEDEFTMSMAITSLLDEGARLKAAKNGRRRGRQFNLRNYYFDMIRVILGEKKIAFLGTGDQAYDAIQHFGRAAVGCFVNFNPFMREKELYGVPVLSEYDFLKNAEAYRPVLISSHYDVIMQKLEASGIHSCEYFSTGYEWTLNEIKKQNCSQIVLLGSGMMDVFSSDLKRRLGKEVVCISDEKDSQKLLRDAELIMISDPGRHSMLMGLAMKEKNAKAIVLDPFQRRLQFDTDRVVINPYRKSAVNRSEDIHNERIAAMGRQAEIDSFVQAIGTEPAIFSVIEIETINRCNGECSFCPVNHRDDTRKLHVMSRELFEKIITELSEIGYRGHVTLYSNNEPLLDPYISERAAFARLMLPNAVIHLFTNGTLLTMEKFLSLILYVDEMVIDNYSRKHQLHKNSQAVYEYIKEHRELRRKVTIVIRDPEEILSTRGGDAPNRKNMVSYPENGCALPFQQMVVRPDGRLSLCCNDPLGKETLGNLNEQTIMEAWNSESYITVRKELACGRGKREHCRYCDAFDIY